LKNKEEKNNLNLHLKKTTTKKQKNKKLIAKRYLTNIFTIF